MTRPQNKALRRLAFPGALIVLFFLTAARLGTMVQPSQAQVRAAIYNKFDPELVTHLQIDAIYGSAWEGEALVVFHSDVVYGWLRLRPQLSNWVASEEGLTQWLHTFFNEGTVYNYQPVSLGRQTAWLLIGRAERRADASLVAVLDNQELLRSPIRNGVFSQLVKPPRAICFMRIVDANDRVLLQQPVKEDMLYGRPVADISPCE